jgi:serine protease
MAAFRGISMHDQLRPALCAAFVIVAAALAVQAPVTAAPRTPVAAPAAKPTPAPTDRFIVAFKDDAIEKRNPIARQHLLDALGRRLGVRVSHGRGLANGAEVIRTNRKLGADEAKKLLLALYNDPRVAYVEVDRVHVPRRLPRDPLQSRQPQLFRDIGGHGFDFAWERGTGAGVVVAVVDTGIVAHEDLDANVVAGYDFLGRDADPTDDWMTCSAHGTEVAGVIAAVGDNALGIAGAAHGASIQPIRALGGCDGGTTSDIADAITWAAGGAVDGVPANATPAQVINLSFATNGSCGPTLQAAINSATAAGAVVVAAAGDGSTFGPVMSRWWRRPAAAA